MNATIVLTPEQYEEMKRTLKSELMSELSIQPKTIGAYSPEWISVRDELEMRMKSNYSAGCGHWYQNQQGLYAAFRLAFKKDSIRGLRGVKPGKLKQFHDELFTLIDKYREDGELK